MKEVLEQIEELKEEFETDEHLEKHCRVKGKECSYEKDCCACVLKRVIEIIKEKEGKHE